jgi:glycosyltransferase involved in cell wall biosynthesis
VEGGRPDVATAKRLKILALAPNAWDGPWMNRQQLLSRLGRLHPIVYSTGPRRRFQGTAVQPTLWPTVVSRDNVSIDLIPTWMARTDRISPVKRVIMRQLARRWRHLLDAGDGVFVGWSFHPKFWPLIACVNPDRIVYHAYDLYHKQGVWPRELAEYEMLFVRHAHLVIASSEPIAEYLTSRGARSILIVENGVDYEAFSRPPVDRAEPEDLASVPRPRIGYTGALNRKVDFPLLADLATRHQEWNFIFIGAIGNLDHQTSIAVAKLSTMQNVHFLGFKNRKALPAYMCAMDVNLLAYRVASDLWTEGIYPLKLHEYLATGRPVVGAGLSTLKPFSNVIAIADTADEWENAIAAALIDASPERLEQRREVARANSWETRVALLERELAQQLR